MGMKVICIGNCMDMSAIWEKIARQQENQVVTTVQFKSDPVLFQLNPCNFKIKIARTPHMGFVLYIAKVSRIITECGSLLIFALSVCKNRHVLL